MRKVSFIALGAAAAIAFTTTAPANAAPRERANRSGGTTRGAKSARSGGTSRGKSARSGGTARASRTDRTSANTASSAQAAEAYDSSEVEDLRDEIEKLRASLAQYAKAADLAQYAKKTEVPAAANMTEYAKKSEIPAAPDLSGYALKTEVPAADASGLATKAEVAAVKASIPAAMDLSAYALKTEIPAAAKAPTATGKGGQYCAPTNKNECTPNAAWAGGNNTCSSSFWMAWNESGGDLGTLWASPYRAARNSHGIQASTWACSSSASGAGPQSASECTSGINCWCAYSQWPDTLASTFTSGVWSSWAPRGHYGTARDCVRQCAYNCARFANKPDAGGAVKW